MKIEIMGKREGRHRVGLKRTRHLLTYFFNYKCISVRTIVLFKDMVFMNSWFVFLDVGAKLGEEFSELGSGCGC